MAAAAKRILPYLPVRPAYWFLSEDAMPLLDFLTLYVLAVLWLLLALPVRWFRRVIQIAFGVR